MYFHYFGFVLAQTVLGSGNIVVITKRKQQTAGRMGTAVSHAFISSLLDYTFKLRLTMANDSELITK